MEYDILSLKNLYRLLTVNDYPIYSTGVIQKKELHGLTLLKFWQDMLRIEFRKEKYGKVIWRNTGSRNRYLSEICNRSDRLHMYAEYAAELAKAVCTKTMLLQIGQFMDFLESRKFSYEVFSKKIEAYIRQIGQSDPCITNEIRKYFEELCRKLQGEHDESNDESTNMTEEKPLFLAGWCLTILMLYSMTGDSMAEPAMAKLRTMPEFDAENLWKLYQNNKESHSNDQLLILTGLNSEICCEPLERNCFFGREEELFDLREMLGKGGHYLLSGIGGIGKTELLRQFYKICVKEKLAERVAVIQYESNLQVSMARAFPDIQLQDAQNNYKEALGRLRRCGEKKLLVIIDNMNNTIEEDTSLSDLALIPGTVILTSRLSSLEGFETYHVNPPSKTAGMLIFRENYKRMLSPEDKMKMEELYENQVWWHTLTLRMLGQASRVRGWSISELCDRLTEGEKMISWNEQNQSKHLHHLYRRMYSLAGLTKKEISFLALFCRIPYGNYDIEFIQNRLMSEQDTAQMLDHLQEYGWIEKRKEGWMMHPFVAECVKSAHVLKREDCDAVFAHIWNEWSRLLEQSELIRLFSWSEMIPDCWKNELTAAEAVTALIQSYPQRLPKEWNGLLLLALEILQYYSVLGKQGQSFYTRLMQNESFDGKEHERLAVILGRNRSIKIDEVLKEIECQQIQSTEEDFLYTDLLLVGADLLLESSRFEEAKKLTQKAQERKLDITRKIEIALLKSQCARMEGQMESALEETLAADALLDGQSTINYVTKSYVGGVIGNILMMLQRTKEAEKYTQKLKEAADKSGMMMLQLDYQVMEAFYNMYTGNPQAAEKSYRKQLKMLEYLENPDSFIVANTMSLLAISLNKNGKHEEAKNYYEKAIAIWQKHSGNEFDIQRCYNNLGVMYLDWEKENEALECLTKAYKMAKEANWSPVATAEAANNLSKVYGKLGEREKELLYLNEAYPLLETVYGPENPKVKEAARRLKAENL